MEIEPTSPSEQFKEAEILSESPVPQESAPPIKVPVVEEIETIDFSAAISRVILGAKVTREEWDDKETYVHLADGFLMIHKEDGKNYQLIVSEADMKAEDWILIN